jgi:predicted DNA-binding transcriptional regulator AlpA
MKHASSLNRDEFMTVKEGAWLVGIDVSTLYKRIRGLHPPPCKRIGGRVLLMRAAFVEWATQDVIE